MVRNVSYNPDDLAALCKRHGIANLSFFGSVLRDDFDPDTSDVDVLIEFETTASKTLFDLVETQDALTEFFGRPSHLSMPNSLSKYFRDQL